VIAKTFAEQGVRGRLREIVLGVLLVEDLIAVLLITVLTAVASAGRAPGPGELAMTGVRLAAFLAALLGVGLAVVPRLVRAVVRLDRAETTVVTAVGVCFAGGAARARVRLLGGARRLRGRLARRRVGAR
jgi:CPA2 family monovalent cation:H+ antiporter-2